MRNCVCHNLPVCETGYGLRVFNEGGDVIEYIMTGLTRREALRLFRKAEGHIIQLMAHRRPVAQR